VNWFCRSLVSPSSDHTLLKSECCDAVEYVREGRVSCFMVLCFCVLVCCETSWMGCGVRKNHYGTCRVSFNLLRCSEYSSVS
jgi:hypothetical protein